jgi:hypothetical protein
MHNMILSAAAIAKNNWWNNIEVKARNTQMTSKKQINRFSLLQMAFCVMYVSKIWEYATSKIHLHSPFFHIHQCELNEYKEWVE